MWKHCSRHNYWVKQPSMLTHQSYVCGLLLFSIWQTFGLALRLQRAVWSMSNGLSLNDRIRAGVEKKFPSTSARVLGCWDNFINGAKLHRHIDKAGECLQTADCFVEGLRAMPFHDTETFPWIPALEDNYKVVLQELKEFENRRRGGGESELQDLAPTGNGMEGDGLWLGPRDTSGNHYGPEWKTLGLQVSYDRHIHSTYIMFLYRSSKDVSLFYRLSHRQ